MIFQDGMNAIMFRSLAILLMLLHNMLMNEAYYADCEQIEQLIFGEKNVSRINRSCK